MRALPLIVALLSLLTVSGAGAQAPRGVNISAILAERPPATLAAYGLFSDASARIPNGRVTPYALNTELYSDGALKFRYVFIPDGQSATYREDGVFDFPVGTVLVKTFAFAADMRAPSENVRFLETRLLIHKEDGWVALPYVWNDDGTEATYSPIGATLPVDFTNEDGAPTHLDWRVPNRNQCKGCHDTAGEIAPIGPTARNLNRDNALMSVQELMSRRRILFWSGPAPRNQLDFWRLLSMLPDAPETHPLAPDSAPRAPNAYDPQDGSLNERARAYLHVNCAHCHNPQGPAHTSGLDLRWSVEEPALWGVHKRPVAAGRASANMDFAIAPGDPDHSILLYRMQSLDPGVMMPELGRQTVDARAVALIRDWIAGMDENGAQRAESAE